tara:strand:+ start:8914 stop:9048 length:135 start_codon:yes stop_codon:yes gene_type:complete
MTIGKMNQVSYLNSSVFFYKNENFMEIKLKKLDKKLWKNKKTHT